MTTFESAFKEIKQLVTDFKANEKYFLSSEYSEARVREDYINKFFDALGWDVWHDKQKNPYEQEVKVEKGVKVGKAQKRSDYAFHLAPNFRDPVFFVEAKKPARALSNPDDYFQAIRYGWNANTPIVILTDFEEFHIIDSRFKPDIDTALNKKLLYFHYSEYADKGKFAEIYYLFSREAVGNNSIEKWAEVLPKPRGKAIQRQLFPGGYQSIDESFLEEIDEIRMTLARAFKKSNPALQGYELTEATHRTIDRLVFIRFLEDKLIEQEHYISEFGESNDVWNDFVALSKRLNAKYNGVVFKHHFIDDTGFNISDNIFGNICEELSHLNSPYDFDKIPIHILGSIYERFLGKVIHTTAKRVTIEEKPEVKKAGGVYYTPQYIVRYIVANTIGKLIAGKTPLQISRLRFADIACGSGSFLIAIFDTLLDYHNNWYQNNPAKAKNDGCFYQDGKWILSLKQKKNILLNNIYGVDIDSQAVEVTQLSLCLKLMEDETTATANEMQVLFHEKILPDLTKNIVCGNSLINTDILFSDLFSEKENEGRKLNPMTFEYAFSDIMDDGGFDAIVGNPPYIKEYTAREIFENVKKSHLKKYYQGKMDLWYFFTCYGIDLLKENGYLSLIAPNNWITNAGASIMRNKILSETELQIFFDFNDFKVFQDASIQTMVFVLEKKKPPKSYKTKYFKVLNRKMPNAELANILINHKANNDITACQTSIKPKELQNQFINFIDSSIDVVLNKISSASNFHFQEKDITQGIVPNPDCINNRNIKTLLKHKFQNVNVGDGVFVIDEDELSSLHLNQKEKEFLKPYYTNVDRYFHPKPMYKILYLTKKNCPSLNGLSNIEKHLKKYKPIMDVRRETKQNKIAWFQLHWPRNEKFFNGEKIQSLRKTAFPKFCYTTSSDYISLAANVIRPQNIDLKYLTGILNSKVIFFWLYHKGKKQGEQLQIDKEPLLQIPIIKTDKPIQDKIVRLVEQMLQAKQKLASAKMDRDINYYERRCTGIDREINNEVYKLYNLSQPEINIIEKISEK